MRSLAIAAILAAATLALPATAANEKKQPPPGERIICKRQSDDTGSRLNAKRVCATAREWAERADMLQETRRNIEKIQRERAH